MIYAHSAFKELGGDGIRTGMWFGSSWGPSWRIIQVEMYMRN
jgi:hypothetical protein